MDNCNYNLNSSFTKFGANDTTNCQLKIDKDNFNRYKDTLTKNQIYSNIAKRTVRNFSVCIPDISNTDIDNKTGGDPDKSPPPTPSPPTSPPNSPRPPDNSKLAINMSKATPTVSDPPPDQIPEIVVESSYPSCSYKPIKF